MLDLGSVSSESLLQGEFLPTLVARVDAGEISSLDNGKSVHGSAPAPLRIFSINPR